MHLCNVWYQANHPLIMEPSDLVCEINNLKLYPMTDFLTGRKWKHLQTTKQMWLQKMKLVFGKGRKHCGKRTSIFSFSLNVFKRPSFSGMLRLGLCGKELLYLWNVSTYVSLHRSKIRLHLLFFICMEIIALTLSQTINFRLFKTERGCRRLFQIWWKWHKVLKKAISPFFHIVFKRPLLQTVLQ